MKPHIDYSIYLVADRGNLTPAELLTRTEAALRGGVTLVQYRDKQAEGKEMYELALKLQKLCAAFNVPFLVNDRIDIAMAVQADGVHLGQDDIPCEVARKLLGKDAIIGISAHNACEARAAEAAGADYLGCGAIAATATKPDCSVLGLDGLKKIRWAVQIPFVGIGGINQDNYLLVRQSGAAGCAIVSAILQAKDVEQAAATFKHLR